LPESMVLHTGSWNSPPRGFALWAPMRLWTKGTRLVIHGAPLPVNHEVVVADPLQPPVPAADGTCGALFSVAVRGFEVVGEGPDDPVTDKIDPLGRHPSACPVEHRCKKPASRFGFHDKAGIVCQRDPRKVSRVRRSASVLRGCQLPVRDSRFEAGPPLGRVGGAR